MAANNKQNVSTTRGVRGGYFLSAPIGTTDVPTKATFDTWTPSSAWENEGYVVEDGLTESVSKDGGDALRDINLDQLDETVGTYTETMQVGLMEVAKNPLSLVYGHQNVSDENGTVEVDHNWSKAEEHRMFVFLLVLKNGRKWVKFIPDGKVTERDDLTLNATTVAQRAVTITYLTDEDGSGCKDWIESNETPAPQLTALSLSGTGTSLTPTFAAGTRAYTSAATGTSATVTATAASGYTVAIKDGNGNAYSSGTAIPLVAGTNVVTVTVKHTDTGAEGTYTITITKS